MAFFVRINCGESSYIVRMDRNNTLVHVLSQNLRQYLFAAGTLEPEMNNFWWCAQKICFELSLDFCACLILYWRAAKFHEINLV